MVRLKTNIVLVTSAFLVSVIIHSNYVLASDSLSKSLTDLETPEEPLVNSDDTGEDELKARNKRLVPTLGYSSIPRTLRRVQRSPLEEGEDIAKGTVAEEDGAEESSSKKRKGKKKKKKKKRRKDKKTSSVEEPSEGTSGESDLIKGKTDSKNEPSQDLTPTASQPTDSLSTNDGSNTGSSSSSDDSNNSKTSSSGDSGSGKSQGEDDGSEQRQSKSFKIGQVNVRQDSGQKSKQETINSDTKEIIPLHKDLPPMQRQQQKQIHRQESTQYNRQDTSLPADSVNFDRTSFKMPQMTQMAPLPGMAPLPQMSNFYSPMGGSKASSFTFPNFQQQGPQPVQTNENPVYTANLGYNPYSSGSGNSANSPMINPMGSNPGSQMNVGNFATNNNNNNGNNVPGGSSFLYALSSRAFGNPDGQNQYGGVPGANFFSMNGGFANQAQSSFNSQSSSAQFHDQSFGST